MSLSRTARASDWPTCSSSVVAALMPKRVVDLLESVEVDQQHRGASCFATLERDHLLETVAEQVAVGEPGEAVVQRLMANLVDVLLQTPGDPAQHWKQRQIESQQAEPEHDRDGHVLRACGGCHGGIRLVQLERPAGVLAVEERHRHIGFERLLVRTDATLAVERSDLRRLHSTERPGEFFLEVPFTDQLMLGRVRDGAVRPVQLCPQCAFDEDLAHEQPVQLGAPRRADGLCEIGGLQRVPQDCLGDERRVEAGGLLGVLGRGLAHEPDHQRRRRP